MNAEKEMWFRRGAFWAATASRCVRRQVGAMVFDPVTYDVISVGFNGPPAGEPHCAEGCPRARSGVEPGSSYDTGPGRCTALHAEQNCLMRAGVKARGMWMSLNHEPCQGCQRLIAGSGLSKVIWPDGEWERS